MEKLFNIIKILILVVMLVSCKKHISGLIVENKQNITSYNDLIGKTFFALQNEEGQLVYDSYGVNDMTEMIRFRQTKINHFKPMDWHNYDIINHVSKKTIQIKIKYENKSVDEGLKYFLKYDKEKHLLYSYPSDKCKNPKTYVDSIYLNTIRYKKYPKVSDINVEDNVINKKIKINIESKEIEILIPFLEEYIYHEDNIAGRQGISETLEVKLLKGTNGNLYFVFGEGKCGACPNFSALYDFKGKNLSYQYSIRQNVRGSKIIISKGNDSEVFKKYGLSESNINIQINNQDTPTYLIKNWFN